MSDYSSKFWDERYSAEQYIYGIEPNQFFKEQIDKILTPGRLILPGEGEGRNAVYAAKQGWQVNAFDQSQIAMEKALKLADRNKVKINYSVADLLYFVPIKNYFDAAAIIFIHFNQDDRKSFHQKIIDSLKPGGILILESFSKNQFGKTSGGPQDLSLLYSIEELMSDFKSMRTIIFDEKNITLNEGEKHTGEASVIRFVGEKTI